MTVKAFAGVGRRVLPQFVSVITDMHFAVPKRPQGFYQSVANPGLDVRSCGNALLLSPRNSLTM
jgi:hypothetical protein